MQPSAAISTWEEVGLAAAEGLEVGEVVADCRQQGDKISWQHHCR